MIRTNILIKKGNPNHKWHLVNSSWLPIGVATILFNFVLCNLFFLYAPLVTKYDYIYYGVNKNYFCFFLVLLITIILVWVFVVLRESSQQYHTVPVLRGLRFGMLLFIVSEIMFFFGFFWAYFHSSLIPSIYLGSYWPPIGLQSIDFFGLPLTNTVLLLASGLTLTLAHMALISKTFKDIYLFEIALGMTLDFGLIFLICQGIEYVYGLSFRINENIYSTIFFLITGFHGLHVTIGTVFLLFCYIRGTFKMDITDVVKSLLFARIFAVWGHSVAEWFNDFHHTRPYTWKFFTKTEQCLSFYFGYLPRFRYTIKKHAGFETSAWYWHFVDVVWIFLYLTVYWLFI